MQPRYTDTGVFIAFEGGEGGGKSTQAHLLAERLRAQGHRVLLTHEPGATAVGQQLRAIVLGHDTGELAARTEALLYAADKAEHVESVVLPALADGQVVITDRFVDSALAYQGAGRTLDVAEVEQVNRWATADLRPHLTVILDVDPAVGLSRFDGADRIESEPLEFHQRVRDGFLALASRDPEHYVVVSATETPESVHAAVCAAVDARLGQPR